MATETEKSLSWTYRSKPFDAALVVGSFCVVTLELMLTLNTSQKEWLLTIIVFLWDRAIVPCIR